MFKLLASQVVFKILIAIITFINMALIARFLGNAEHGNFALWITNTAVIIMIVDAGLGQAITYYLSKFQNNSKHFFKSILWIGLAQALIFGIMLMLTLNSYSIGINNSTVFYLILYGLGLILQNNIVQFYHGNKWFKTINIMQVLQQLLILILLVFTKKYVTNYAFVIAIIACVQTVATLLLIANYFTLQKQTEINANKVDWTYLLKIGSILFFTNLLQFIAFRSDYWLLDQYVSKESFGTYAVSSRLIQAFWIIPITIQNFLFPYFNNNEFTNQLGASIKKIFLVCGSIGILSMIVAPIAIPLIFGSAYANSIILFQILMLGSIPMILSMIISPYLISINKKDWNFYSSLFTAMLAVTLYIIFIPKFGTIGAAISSAIAYSFQGLFSLFLFTKSKKVVASLQV
jgi:O-antigen/teichoic acid export membrane protein